MTGEINDNYDAMQILKRVYEEPNTPDPEDPKLLRVRNIGGTLVPEIYDEVYYTYTNIDEPSTTSYYLNGALLVTLSWEYYPDGSVKRIKRL